MCDEVIRERGAQNAAAVFPIRYRLVREYSKNSPLLKSFEYSPDLLIDRYTRVYKRGFSSYYNCTLSTLIECWNGPSGEKKLKRIINLAHECKYIFRKAPLLSSMDRSV